MGASIRKLPPFIGVAAASVFAALLMFSVAYADVNPSMVDEVVSTGGAIEVDKTVDTPEFPPSLDLCLMIDLSGSYNDDLPNIKVLDDGIFDAVSAGVADSQFCVLSFVDFPISPWGSEPSGDYAYRRDQDLTTEKATWTGTIDGLTTFNGADLPESQYEALFQAATGAGNDVPPAGASPGDIAAGQDPSWRVGVTRVIAITTDAAFHDSNDEPGYPGASGDDTVAALNAENIKVVAIKAPGSGAEMDDIAAATGGSVVETGNTSEEIADAILEGITNLPVSVTPVSVGCDPLGVSFVPPSATVLSGSQVSFVETIAVPADSSLEGTSVHCTVDFRDGNGNSIGGQEIWIAIPDETAPVAACVEGPNPAGKVPRAGQQSPGQNEDGFYTLQALDRVDADPQIFIVDDGSGIVFGPFANGTNIKYTQAGGNPSQSPMSGVVDWKIKGNGDLTISAVDADGNRSAAVSCLVPRPPK